MESRTLRKEIAVILLLLIDISLIFLLKDFNSIFDTAIFSYLIGILIIAFLIVLVMFLFSLKDKNKNIIKCIEKNLISIGAVVQVSDNLKLTPKVKCLNNLIEIDIANADIRKKLERNQDILSTFLPTGYITNDIYMSKDEKTLYIKCQNILESTRYTFKNLDAFVQVADALPKDTLILDKDHSINLREQPHLLISGSTGSGKSYYASFLVSLAIYKNYDVDVLDYKQSYTAFEDACQVAYTIDEIYNRLTELRDELHKRQTEMRKVLKDNPNAIASDYGFKTKLIFVEEYMSVVNSGADKKILNEISKILLEITAIGRALSFHLVLITQVSSANNLDTSIRSNLAPMVLGMANSTIYETAFSTKSVPNIATKFEKGEGLAKFDINLVRVSCPTLNFPLSDIWRVGNTHQRDADTLTW